MARTTPRSRSRIPWACWSPAADGIKSIPKFFLGSRTESGGGNGIWTIEVGSRDGLGEDKFNLQCKSGAGMSRPLVVGVWSTTSDTGWITRDAARKRGVSFFGEGANAHREVEGWPRAPGRRIIAGVVVVARRAAARAVRGCQRAIIVA
jgi:hypothetical protein